MARELRIAITADASSAKRAGRETETAFRKVETQAKSTETRIARLTGSLNKFATGARTAGRILTVGVTAPLIAIGAAAIKTGMDVIESENLFEVSFKGMSGSARTWSEETSEALGLNAFELRRNSGLLFTMFKSMGQTEQGAFDMATGMSELSNDMASFFNLRPEEAFEKLRAGIVGEVEPLRRLGILVDEQTVKQTALTAGLIESGQEMDQQTKVQARWLTILNQTTDAQGDLARTMDSPTNQLRRMRSQMEETTAELGLALLPAFQSILDILDDLIPKIKAGVTWFSNLEAPQQKVAIAAAAIAVAAGPLAFMFGAIASALVPLVPLLFAAGAGGTAAAVGLTAANVAAGGAPLLYNAYGVAVSGVGLKAAASGGALAFFWSMIFPIAGAAAVAAAGAAVLILVDKFRRANEGARIAAGGVDQFSDATIRMSQVVDNVPAIFTEGMLAPSVIAPSTAALNTNTGAQTANAKAAAAAATVDELVNSQIEQMVGNLQLSAAELSVHQSMLLLNADSTQTLIAAQKIHVDWTIRQRMELVGLGAEMGRTSVAARTLQSDLFAATMGSLGGGVGPGDAPGGGGNGGFFSSILGGAEGLASTLPGLFQQAFTGGGGALGAVKAFATQGLQSLMAMIPGIGPFLSQFSGAIIAGISKIGGKIKGFFSNLFGGGGPSDQELEGRAVADRFRQGLLNGLSLDQMRDVQQALATGWEGNEAGAATLIAVRDAYLAMGRSAAEAEEIVNRLWLAEQEGGLATRIVIEEITGAMNEQREVADAMRLGTERAAGAVGGPLRDSIQTFGQTADQVFARAVDGLSNLRANAAAGITIPINFDGTAPATSGGEGGGNLSFDPRMFDPSIGGYVIPTLARWRELGNETGNEEDFRNAFDLGIISELKKAGISEERANEWLADNPGDTGRILAGLDVPGFADGTGGLRDFGSGKLAVLHGREGVFPESQTTSSKAIGAEMRKAVTGLEARIDALLAETAHARREAPRALAQELQLARGRMGRT